MRYIIISGQQIYLPTVIFGRISGRCEGSCTQQRYQIHVHPFAYVDVLQQISIQPITQGSVEVVTKV